MQHAIPSSPSQRSRGWKRRIAKACDSCRRKRTRCSGARPVCLQCSSAGATCHYSDQVDRQTRPRSERASHVQRLQERVHELEATLRQYRSSSPARQSPSRTESRSDNGSQQPAAADSHAGRGTMVVEDTGEMRYFGPSSSISILSPDGLQWLESRTADASLRQRLELPLKGGGSWSKWTHPLLQSLWPSTNSTALPPWDDAQTLVNDFCESYNTVLPIFHPPTFMGLLGRQYARSSHVVEDPAWSAALNAVLAMAQRRRAEQNPQARELADCAWAYARNALELILAVHMRSVSLLSVQATITLAWFFRGTPNPQPLFFLTAAAVRLSHSAGLHRGAEHLPLSQTDREQRLRVFWIALIFDSSASLRTGRPCTHSINNIGVRMPSGSPKDNLGIIVNRQGTAVLNFLLAKARFSVLEAKIYDRIFASDSSEKSIEALAADVHDLGKELDEWSRAVPGGTDNGNITDDWDHQHPHIISLLLAYHSCVITVHSATWQRHFASLRGRRSAQQDSDVSSHGFPHAAKCLHAAHQIVKLLSCVPQERTSFIWEVIHRPVQASMLFFICLLQQPDDSNADAHLRAMGVAITFVSKLMSNQEECFIQPVLVVCRELTRIASAAVQRGRARTDRSQFEQASLGQAAATGQSLRSHHQPPFLANAVPGLSGPAPGIPPMSEDELIPSQANLSDATRPTQGSGPTSAEHLASDFGFQELSNFDQGIIGIDQLSELSLPFSWNWQDLSTGLLEDFNLL